MLGNRQNSMLKALAGIYHLEPACVLTMVPNVVERKNSYLPVTAVNETRVAGSSDKHSTTPL